MRHRRIERVRRSVAGGPMVLASQVRPLLDSPLPLGGVVGEVEQVLATAVRLLLGGNGLGGGADAYHRWGMSRLGIVHLCRELRELPAVP